MYDLLPISYFFQLLRVHLLVLTIRLFLLCGLCHLGGEDFGHQPERNFGNTNSLIFVSSALLSLFDAVSRGSQNMFLLFTFVFKYSLRKALVKALAFYGFVSLEMLV